MKCSLNDCEKTASVTPKLCVPYKDLPREGHYPFKLLMDVPVCETCLKRIEPRQLVRHDVKRYVIKAVNALPCEKGFRIRQPDFDRAWLEPIQMESAEYFNMVSALKSGEGETLDFEIGGRK